MSQSWMPRDKWDALVRGEGCPMCAQLAADEQVDAYGFTIAALEGSILRLSTNQYAPGYCVLICKQHVREPYDLPAAARVQFFDDMMRAAMALEQVYHPEKMNFGILGNALPHLHCHIIPRYYGDPAPGRPLDLTQYRRQLASTDAYLEQVEAIRAALRQAQ